MDGAELPAQRGREVLEVVAVQGAEAEIVIFAEVAPLREPRDSIFFTSSMEGSSATSPKIVCLLVSHGVSVTVRKNWDPLVPGPAFAIASRYGRSNCSSGWNSSLNW